MLAVILGVATVVRAGLVALVGLFVVFASASERTTPRWLRRGGYPPRLGPETKKGRQRNGSGDGRALAGTEAPAG